MDNIAYIVLNDETLEVEDTKARTDIGDVTTLKTNVKDNLVKAVNECFQSASDGKALIASAITGKGIETDSDATFEVMASNIALIQTGIMTTDATVTASQILAGAIAYGANGKITGAMANKAGTNTSANASLDTTNSRVKLQIPSNGYYDTGAYLYIPYATLASILGITADKIVVGNTILGITGTGYGTWS